MHFLLLEQPALDSVIRGQSSGSGLVFLPLSGHMGVAPQLPHLPDEGNHTHPRGGQALMHCPGMRETTPASQGWRTVSLLQAYRWAV